MKGSQTVIERAGERNIVRRFPMLVAKAEAEEAVEDIEELEDDIGGEEAEAPEAQDQAEDGEPGEEGDADSRQASAEGRGRRRRRGRRGMTARPRWQAAARRCAQPSDTQGDDEMEAAGQHDEQVRDETDGEEAVSPDEVSEAGAAGEAQEGNDEQRRGRRGRRDRWGRNRGERKNGRNGHDPNAETQDNASGEGRPNRVHRHPPSWFLPQPRNL